MKLFGYEIPDTMDEQLPQDEVTDECVHCQIEVYDEGDGDLLHVFSGMRSCGLFWGTVADLKDGDSDLEPTREDMYR